MIVVVDIGNSRIKWARVDAGQLTDPGQAIHGGQPERAFAALAAAIERPAHREDHAGGGTAPVRILGAAVSTADFRARFSALARARWALEPGWVQSAEAGFGVRCGYREPRRLGVDRWVALIAARRLVESGVCIVDAGTTVTFDAMTADGLHLGGLIMPGPRLAARALDSGTAGIGPTDLQWGSPRGLELLGRSTEEAVSNGTLLAVASAVDRAVAVIADAWGAPPAVLLTGGDGLTLGAWLETGAQYRADLVLEGLAFIVSQS